MKIIEGMKEVKRLEEKVEDLKKKVAQYCANLNVETPTYKDQGAQVKEWLQSVHDSLKRAEEIRLAIQKTNLATIVPIQIGDQTVQKSISAWIIRRRLYANSEKALWQQLGDRNLREGFAKNSAGENVEIKIVRYFSPEERDKKILEFNEEPGLIDRTLEVVNAVTEIGL